MKHLNTLIITLFLMAPVMGLFAQPEPDGINGLVGPEFKFETWIDAEGNPTKVTREDYFGKVIVIYCFQHGSNITHTKNFPDMKELMDKYKGKGVQFLAIQTVMEDPENNKVERLRQNQTKYDLKIPFGHDTGNEVTKGKPFMVINYEIPSVPWSIVISKDGHVLYNDTYFKKDDIIRVVNTELRGW